jgi:repressor of nif and glnA expression
MSVVLDRIMRFIREHDDPGVTIKEVAEEFDELDHSAAKYRMGKLESQGRVRKKPTGASSAIWFPEG